LHLQPLQHRSIQISLTNEAVPLYVNEWIQKITDITKITAEIHTLIQQGMLAQAKSLLPREHVYNVPISIANKISISR